MEYELVYYRNVYRVLINNSHDFFLFGIKNLTERFSKEGNDREDLPYNKFVGGNDIGG